MCRIATHFVSNHQLIQARANAYVRCKLAGAEVHINGVISSQNEQSVEQDQILLTSATVPSSPRDFNNIYNDVINDDANGQLSRASSRRDIGSAADSAKDCATPPPPTLFRSSSVRQEHFNTFPPNLFTMDDRTLRAAMSFMPELFQHNGFVSRKKLPAYDAGRLTELWEFFDFDDDGIVTRDDVMLGLGNIARNFLATDDFTQMLTNSYVQRKIRKAIFAIDKHQRATGSHSATQYSSYESKSETLHRLPIKVKHEPGNTVIYTDEEGNQHVTKIIRMSQRSVAGGDAYYIETKGVKLCVAASRLRPMDEQDSVMLQRIDQNPQGFRQKPHKDTLASNANSTSLSSAAASTVGKGSSSRNGGGLHTPAKQSTAGFSTSSLSAETMGTAPSEDAALPTSASKGGILGYLKSSIGILGIGNGKPTVSAATVIPETQTSYNRSKRKGSGDNESNMKIQEDVESVVEVVGVEGQVEEEGGNEGVCCNMKERDAEGEDEEGVPVPVPMSESNSHSHLTSGLGSSKGSIEEQGQGEAVPTAVSAELVDAAAVVGDAEPTVAAVTTSDNNSNSSSSALSVTTSQRLRQSTAMLALDGEILQAVRKVTGPSYKLTRSMFPRPKKTEPYPIYFNRLA